MSVCQLKMNASGDLSAKKERADVFYERPIASAKAATTEIAVNNLT
jgi:hypothetical protein